ncbi:DNA-formamidopyrimidine glycosylase [Sporolactobacillus sp. CPB3-1]|uniref:Formamidopyrimidine-DNA glycosylase n=1 Tax=Sporolactobacillus mangiferae TaxID=2940498 RepID=A0ABT0M6W1_9BACL|nr:DNA-formamidopyrimidine glycosylase [Sporolactobacillus mangiferae]MCL1630600.1 DNA-formamidopyrimidine glycosylase [Sporolactobacillus mangiferae]
MPELPEVETVKRTLRMLALGKTVKEVEVRWPNIIRRPNDISQFKYALIGKTLRDVQRRGKFLLIHFDDLVLVSHLRMEGRYHLDPEQEPTDVYTHVIFHFTDRTALRYRDVRKFGTMHLFREGEEYKHLPLSKLGPEPLSPNLTAGYLEAAFHKTKRCVKQVLLDQTVVAGLGNIYVDESLFRAGIHPLVPACFLELKQLERLRQAIVDTLSEAVRLGGSTIRTFVNSQGQEGFFQQQLKVYGRSKEPCVRCGTLIEKIKVGGRGTHFCPVCQRKTDRT